MQFHKSESLTFGLELELQIVDPSNGRLSPSSMEILALLSESPQSNRFAPEATLATIELNSSIHRNASEMEIEIRRLTQAVRAAANRIGRDVRGGGTQVTQFWNERIIAPTQRARELEEKFGFLPKRFSTYGMHVHVGMPDADIAVRIANVLQSFCPLFIALSAASPFLQLEDTGFAAARPLEPLVYPHGGPMPLLRDWGHFEEVMEDLYATQIASNVKDVYWDVRPKPEFGTIEVRVFDTPLSVRKAVVLAALTRGIAELALTGAVNVRFDSTTFEMNERVSRFNACRHAMEAQLFNPGTGQWVPARAWLQQLLETIADRNSAVMDSAYIAEIQTITQQEQDHVVMRNAWRAAQTVNGSDGDIAPALVAYSRPMCERLLS